MANWTQEDVDRINAQRGAKLPAHLPPSKITTHKYRAEPCIVTADLTLFTRKDIERAEVARPLAFPLPKLKASLKMRAESLDIHGEWFGSTKEGKRYIELKNLERLTLIRSLQMQTPFELCANGVTLGQWRADFTYDELEPGGVGHADVWTPIVEDCKGLKTALYAWKKRHVEAQYGITITET